MEFSKEFSCTSSFRDIVDKNCIYVDKTELIARLSVKKGPFVFTRPRGFGKSTLVSTLHELFENGLIRFHGLKIENLWQDKTYKVIHLDFSCFKECSSARSFKITFNQILLSALKKAHLSVNALREDDGPSDLLSETLMNINSTELVLLIDDCDAPLVAVLDDKTELSSRQKLLSNFFSTVKSYQGVFRFVFITGEINSINTSLFTSFNHIEDLTLDSDYGALVAFTDDELEQYFSLYIDRACVVLNQQHQTEKYTHQSVIDYLLRNYGDYCFDNKCKEHVYNPSSVVNFLSDTCKGNLQNRRLSEEFRDSCLVSFLRQKFSENEKEELQSLQDFSSTIFIAQTSIAQTKLFHQDELSDIDLYVILYQLGYLSLKSSRKGILSLGLPNFEAKKALLELLTSREKV